MIKVLVVGHEYLIKNMLINEIDWLSMECEIVGLAENGKEAIELINRELPDIVLTDIIMPEMNGLELAKHIRYEFPFIKVAIVTGYCEFNYAQEALRAGVNDYILVPSGKEEIHKSIERIVSLIDEERKIFREQEQKDRSLTQKLTFLRAKVFDDIINGFSPDIEQQNNKLGDFIKKNCIYIIISVEISDSKQRQAGDNIMEYYSQLRHKVEEYSNDGEYDYVVSAVKGALYIILFFDNGTSSNQIIKQSKIYAENLQKYIREEMHTSISLGISRCCIDINELSKVYWEAECRLRKETLLSKDGVLVQVEEGERGSEDCNLVGLRDLEGLVELIRFGDRDAIINASSTYFNNIAKTKEFSLEYLRSICIDIVLMCTRILNETNNKIDSKEDNELSLYYAISQLDSFQEYIDWTTEFLLKAMGILADTSKTLLKKSVVDALDFIDKNYMEDISLTRVAEYVHTHPVYLGRLLRKEFGENFSDILVKTRVENAKKLLKDLSIKTYEVAFSVGIKDPHYFSQVFKKYTGMTPTEFRESIGKNQA